MFLSHTEVKSKLLVLVVITSLSLPVYCLASVSDYNVVWNSPSANYYGSMPIGNGDIGANVWVEDGGDLLFYISKTDSWSENARLLKLGKIRVRLSPNPFEKGCTFRQELDLENGLITIKSSTDSPTNSVDLRFWIDANNPVIRITASMSAETNVEVMLEHWRTERKQAVRGDRSFYGLVDRDAGRRFAYPIFIEPDTIVDTDDNTIVWYHRNDRKTRSVWEDTLRVQGLEGFIEKSRDPLRNLTFGALVEGTGLTGVSPTHLKSADRVNTIDLFIYPVTAQTETADKWIKIVEGRAAEYKSQPQDALLRNHKRWWNRFWNRSFIHIDGKPGDDSYSVARGYALQRWITAGSGRGNMPIRFNGSIFTVDGTQVNNNRYLGPDYRSWGSCYWWQNTRLPYWPMLAAGDFEFLKPLFKMYLDALPLARYRMNEYYGFDGAYFPETMYFWGTYNNENYGWRPDPNRHPDLIRNVPTRYEWQGGIELTAMMLSYYHHTLDTDFLNESLLPFAKQIVAFYDNRYERNDEGKLVIYPAAALEDIVGCTNPTPEIAGLKFILPQLINLVSDTNDKENYIRFLDEIPDLETDISDDGIKYILPAQKGVQRKGNAEKPECYAIFPYRLYGVGLPDLETAKETFRLSPRHRSNGWVQDPIFAAAIGDVDEAKKLLVRRSKHFHSESRFPAFWGPNYDWVPDQCHGGVNMITLQHMLLQTEPYTDKIHLFPAWPKEWDVSFKLHAPGNTIVQGRVEDGKVISLEVNPECRTENIINYLEKNNK